MIYLHDKFSAGAEHRALKGTASRQPLHVLREASYQQRVHQLYQEYSALGAQIQGIGVSCSGPPIRSHQACV